MKILVMNVNTTASMTETMREGAQSVARPGTEILAMEPTWGPASVEGYYESYISAAAILDRLHDIADPARPDGAITFDALVWAGFGEHGKEAAMELRVKSTPFPAPGADQILLVCQDISAEKRREVLEAVFFHDVLNTLSGLRGWTHVLKAGLGDTARAIEKLDSLSERVLHEIKSHRLITQAERGELAVRHETIGLEDLMADWQTAVEHHPSCDGKTVTYRPVHEPMAIQSDPDLLRRILLNMALNALEATDPGGVVTAWVECSQNLVTFCVHNHREIPAHVAQRIFQRSYSTKAVRGRGLGTYSMRLFGESFLGGKVSFTTSAGEGTVFRFALPH